MNGQLLFLHNDLVETLRIMLLEWDRFITGKDVYTFIFMKEPSVPATFQQVPIN